MRSEEKKTDVVVVGGGAAGMMAAIMCARGGCRVVLCDKNEKLGKKVYITGKGRCNVTNNCDVETLLKNVMSNPRFMYSSFYGFDSSKTIDFFEKLGVRLKTERGNRVFPESDHSSDIIQALSRELNRLNVEVKLYTEVKEILTEDGSVCGVAADNAKIFAKAVVVATGGLSYKTTGSTGDGYKFAKKAGHTVTELAPSLVPVIVKEKFVKDLQGLSLKNIRVSIYSGKKEIYDDFGEMVFTDKGVSGPVILSSSSYISEQMLKGKQDFEIRLDLKPALTIEELDARILRDFSENTNKQFKNSLDKLLPNKMTDVIVSLSGIQPDKQVNSITKEERNNLARLLKCLVMHVEALGEYKEAVITKGGVMVKEINPATMESKIINGLYFVGEVLDVDALTGGFNLQIAWATGYAAGTHIAENFVK